MRRRRTASDCPRPIIFIVITVFMKLNRLIISSFILLLFFSQCTPLHYSVRRGHLDFCRLLVESNADVAARERCFSRAALPPLTIFHSLYALQRWLHCTQNRHRPKASQRGCIPSQHRHAAMTRYINLLLKVLKQHFSWQAKRPWHNWGVSEQVIYTCPCLRNFTYNTNCPWGTTCSCVARKDI
jgi:hypothetical protein